MPVGSTETVKVDVRIICATNKPLEEMVEEGSFREDLYYRLNVFPLYIPPLRERKGDIGLIVRYLLQQYNEFYGRQVEDVDNAAVELLQREEWKGNVRELENVLSRAFINMDPASVCLKESDIAQALSRESAKPKTPAGGNVQTSESASEENTFDVPENINEAVASVERFCIRRALEQCGGDKNRAAVVLGLPLRTLYYKCKKYEI